MNGKVEAQISSIKIKEFYSEPESHLSFAGKII